LTSISFFSVVAEAGAGAGLKPSHCYDKTVEILTACQSHIKKLRYQIASEMFVTGDFSTLAVVMHRYYICALLPAIK